MVTVGVLILPRMYYVCYQYEHNGQHPKSVQSELYNTGQVRIRGLNNNGDNAATKFVPVVGVKNDSNIENDNSGIVANESLDL
jgi:hypothetical protein